MAVLHTLPSTLSLTRAFRKVHRSSVPVLMFHGVLPNADTCIFNSRGKIISPEKLGAFLERITRIFRIVSIEEFVVCMVQGDTPSNMMVLTFDDGYENVYVHAYPLLKKMGLPFTVFVTTGFVDTAEVLSWDLLNYAVSATDETVLPRGVLPHDLELGMPEAKMKALSLLKKTLKSLNVEKVSEHVERICEDLHVRKDAPELNDVRFLTSGQIREMADHGVLFGGHTVTHPILSKESAERVRTEVRECKSVLESLTGTAVTVFAYPNGGPADFNEMVKNELREAGYTASFTTIHGLHRTGDDLFEIRRIGVDNQWSYEEFETRASGILKVFRR